MVMGKGFFKNLAKKMEYRKLNKEVGAIEDYLNGIRGQLMDVLREIEGYYNQSEYHRRKLLSAKEQTYKKLKLYLKNGDEANAKTTARYVAYYDKSAKGIENMLKGYSRIMNAIELEAQRVVLMKDLSRTKVLAHRLKDLGEILTKSEVKVEIDPNKLIAKLYETAENLEKISEQNIPESITQQISSLEPVLDDEAEEFYNKAREEVQMEAEKAKQKKSEIEELKKKLKEGEING